MILAADIDAIFAFAIREGAGETTVAALRKSRPDYHFTHCFDDDITAASPVRAAASFKLYLVTGAGGCISFTGDPESATGLVLAQTEPDA